MGQKLVIALGGNALERKGMPATAEAQLDLCRATACHIADIIAEGNDVVISHGNGPQVGRIVIATEAAREMTPAMPFDVCGAMSQGYIGYQLQQSLQNELMRRGIDKPVVTVVTQVVVDPHDKAFTQPTKPIGPFYTESEAKEIARDKGYTMKEDSGRGWRRVVASPVPLRIAELAAIKKLTDSGCVVIACGGGGIPVIENDCELRGVAAVIDKDFASAKLAEDLGADKLCILTEVENAFIDFGKPSQTKLEQTSPEEIEKYIEEGHFAPGSMLPKIKASLAFAKSKPGRTAVISSLANAKDAVKSLTGTRITAQRF